MTFSRSSNLLGMAGLFISINQLQATTYYVSPTGNDSSTGTSPSAAWQSLSKVDSTTFAPGSQILLQDGGNWYASQLIASSDGTPQQPIVYGSYGNGPAPTLWGSRNVNVSQLQSVTGSTYFYPSTTPINAFYMGHQFTNNATLITGQSADAPNISYVESTPNSSYYVGGNNPGELVNTGLAPQYMTPFLTFSAGVQDDVVLSYGHNNVIFQNMTVRESAKINAGYGVRVQNSTNVQVLNFNVSSAGKHAVGSIDSTAFLGQGISASNLMPNQGFGGATAFVSYADYNVFNTTSAWINDSFTNPNGAYPGFITHADGNAANLTPISSILLQNLTSVSGPAISIQSASAGEQVTINGGQVTGNVDLTGNNSVVNGLTLNGASADIHIIGNNNVIENSIVNGDVPNTGAGRNAAIDVVGANNIIRFNSISLGAGTGLYEAAIGIEMNGQQTQIYGNIINTQYAAFFQANGGNPGVNAHDNLFSGYGTPEVIYPYASATPVSAWPTSVSANELYGDAQFSDPTSGDFSLQTGSIGAYVFNPATNQYVMYDYYGNVRPSILESLGAVQVPAAGTTGTSWNVDGNGDWAVAANWSNGLAPNSPDIIALLGPSITAPRTVSLSTSETVGVLYFSSPITYTVTGPGTLNFQSSSGFSAIDVSAGNHTIAAAIKLLNNTAVNLAASSVLTVSGSVSGTGPLVANGAGTLLLSANASIGVPLVANGNLIFGAGTGPGMTTKVIPSLTIGALASAVVADASNHSSRTLLTINSLNFSAATRGTLDLNSNDLDLPGASLALITSEVQSGFNLAGGGNWNGNGIISSAAAADPKHLHLLGVLQNSTGTSVPLYGGKNTGLGGFDGTTPGLNDILVKYTYAGDANLDGKVDGSDYSRIDAGIISRATGWYNGDFNYDGVIDGSDYALIDNSFSIQAASLAAQVNPTVQISAEIAGATSGHASGIASVPEPTGSLLLVVGAAGSLRRRRQSRTGCARAC